MYVGFWACHGSFQTKSVQPELTGISIVLADDGPDPKMQELISNKEEH